MSEIVLQHKTYLASPDQIEFLWELIRWTGAATPRELGPQISQKENSARQTCKRRGWATYDGHYWRITKDGERALVEQLENVK